MSAKAQPEHPGIKALRAILKASRWDDQGGYVSYKGNGKWFGTAMGLHSATPAQMNAMFGLVGVVPDVIVPKGDCKDCKHAIDGRERGYSPPCGGCGRPRMTNFVPLRRVARKARKKK